MIIDRYTKMTNYDFNLKCSSLCDQVSAQISDNADIGNAEIDESSEADVCFFCDKIVPKDNKASHKVKQSLDLLFNCN